MKGLYSPQLNCRMWEGVVKEVAGILYQIYRFRGGFNSWVE